jgi:hypothetical protein
MDHTDARSANTDAWSSPDARRADTDTRGAYTDAWSDTGTRRASPDSGSTAGLAIGCDAQYQSGRECEGNGSQHLKTPSGWAMAPGVEA